MREIIKEARNVDEAIELACRELGVERDLVEFEIISLPKRGFFGFRNTPAKVRVYLEEPTPVSEKPVSTQIASNAQKNIKNTNSMPKSDFKKKPEPKSSVKQQKTEIKKKPSEQTVSRPELQFASADNAEGKAKTAADYVKGVLAEMGVSPEISVACTENGIVLRLSGEGLGVIIGRRGETLDSLQYLAGLVANREEGDYMRVTIDSGNYREKRERTLEQLAQKLSASAIRYGRPSTLEPMNPYERRIIHATVSNIEGVTSTSVGEEPNRRVVITPDQLKPQSNNRGGRNGRGSRPNQNGKPYRKNEARGERRSDSSFNDRRRDDRAKFNPKQKLVSSEDQITSTAIDREYAREIEKEAPAFVKPEFSEKPIVREIVRENVAPVRTEAPKEGADLPLYGKIEL